MGSTLSTRFDELSGAMVKLETLECFMGCSIFSIGVDNERGLGIGDGVAEAIEFYPVVMAKRGRPAECSSMGGSLGPQRFFFELFSSMAMALTSGATKMHLAK